MRKLEINGEVPRVVKSAVCEKRNYGNGIVEKKRRLSSERKL